MSSRISELARQFVRMRLVRNKLAASPATEISELASQFVRLRSANITKAKTASFQDFILGPKITADNPNVLKEYEDLASRWLNKRGIKHEIKTPFNLKTQQIKDTLSAQGPFAMPDVLVSDQRKSLSRGYKRALEMLRKQMPDMDLSYTHDRLADIRNDLRLGRGYIFTDRKAPEFLMHEAGHLANTDTIKKLIGGKNTRLFARTIRNPSLLLGSGLAAGAANYVAPHGSTVDQYAWTLPWAASAPMLTGEAAASVRGLNALRKAKGLGAALKGATRLGGAFSTYLGGTALLSLPALMAHRTKTIPDAK